MSVEARPKLGFGQLIGLAIIGLYRVTLAYIIGGRCRFYPSCSKYGDHAIRNHGLGRGVLLTAKRILRCHPFNPGGYDPVPAPKRGES